jgi:hypothetical protein
MSGMSTEEARELIARHLVSAAVHNAMLHSLVTWEDFPDIGEHDWLALIARVNELVAPMAANEETFTAAYTALANRAEVSP